MHQHPHRPVRNTPATGLCQGGLQDQVWAPHLLAQREPVPQALAVGEHLIIVHLVPAPHHEVQWVLGMLRKDVPPQGKLQGAGEQLPAREQAAGGEWPPSPL